jgi:hypothetical protein
MRFVQLAARATVRRDLARLSSTLGAPAPVASALLLATACYTSKTLVAGVALGALLAVGATVPATLYIEYLVRRGERTQRYLSRSSERLAPLAIGCASVVMLVLLVRTLDASRELQTVLLTMLFTLALAVAATPLTRVSVHAAALIGTTVVLQLLFGSIGLAVLPIAAIVGWSRLELGEHTPQQVLSGGIVGVMGASAAYALLG